MREWGRIGVRLSGAALAVGVLLGLQRGASPEDVWARVGPVGGVGAGVPPSGYGAVVTHLAREGAYQPSPGFMQELASHCVGVARGNMWAGDAMGPAEQKRRMDEFVRESRANGITPFVTISIQDPGNALQVEQLEDFALWMTEQHPTVPIGLFNEPNANQWVGGAPPHFAGTVEDAVALWNDVVAHIGRVPYGPQLARCSSRGAPCDADDVDWLRRWIAGIDRHPEVVTVHYYGRASRLADHIQNVGAAIFEGGGGTPDIWITEHAAAPATDVARLRESHLHRSLEGMRRTNRVKAVFPYHAYENSDGHLIEPSTLGAVYCRDADGW